LIRGGGECLLANRNKKKSLKIAVDLQSAVDKAADSHVEGCEFK
jgi:hypothetical protein